MRAEWSIALPALFAAALLNAAVPGGIAVIDVPTDSAHAWYRQQPVLLLAPPQSVAVVGIPLEAATGRHALVVESADARRETIEFDVGTKDYPEQRIAIANPDMVNPPPETLARIERETQQMRAVFARFSPPGEVPFPMTRPTPGPVSSEFGLRRVFNGEPRAPHTGLDIAAPRGEPVIAPAAGSVALTGDFYFNGNTVLIDHGGGVITMACHLSSIDVEAGDQVHRGQIIGRVGATGRVTGPHLHWTLSMNGERVDPEQALTLFAGDPG